MECRTEVLLLKALGFSGKDLNHQGGKGKVCNRLKRTNKAWGLIDKDPESFQPSYLKNLEVIKEEDDIKILYDHKRENTVVMLCPRFEEWILKTAKSAKINLRDYGIPNNPLELWKEINFYLRNLERLIHKLLEKNPSRLKTLKNALSTWEPIPP